jgi:hypothetical protein
VIDDALERLEKFLRRCVVRLNAIDERGLKARICHFRPIWGTNCLLDDLRKLGYVVEKIGESQRILPHAVAQRFEVSSSGALIPATEGSSSPVSEQITNAGIATVEQYDLRMS